MPHRNPPVKDVIQYLQALRQAGVMDLPRVEVVPTLESLLPTATSPSGVAPAVADSSQAGTSPKAAARAGVTKAAPANPTAASPVAATTHTEAYPAPMDAGRRGHALEILAEEVAQCQRCEDLAPRRKQTVFGVGSPHARVALFGEAPGADEDRVGEPFVGAAGQLLDRILAASTFSRDQVYILNTIKCRPPGNRNPNEAELLNCCGYWQRQLEIIQPEYIVCLGAFAIRALLQVETSIARLRGRFHEYRGSKVITTYHPAYLLRNESAKRLVWEDMKMLMRDMGIEIPQTRG